MRLFVALYPSREALDHVAAAVDRLRLGAAAAAGTNLRITARPLWHLTLAFLGEVPEQRAEAAAGALAAGAQRWRERAARPPVLRLAGGGKFGRRQSTLLWIGLAGEVDSLAAIARQVRRGLRENRLPYDRKPFHPHLTFARPGDRLAADDLAADLADLATYQGPEWTADAVHLVRSYPGPRPVHESLAAAPLAGAPNLAGSDVDGPSSGGLERGDQEPGGQYHRPGEAEQHR